MVMISFTIMLRHGVMDYGSLLKWRGERWRHEKADGVIIVHICEIEPRMEDLLCSNLNLTPLSLWYMRICRSRYSTQDVRCCTPQLPMFCEDSETTTALRRWSHPAERGS